MAQSELKTLHPYLYKRVRLKALLFTALGLSQLFSFYVDQVAAERNVVSHIPFHITGTIFILIGIGIAYGLFKGAHDYRISKVFLRIAFFYALFWELLIVLSVITESPSTAGVMILWTYLTYNLYIVGSDSGWDGVELLREIKKDAQNGRK